VTDEQATESLNRSTRETATGGVSCVVLEGGWASPPLKFFRKFLHLDTHSSPKDNRCPERHNHGAKP